MIRHLALLPILACPVWSQDDAAALDPTRPSPRMKAALMAGSSALPPLSVSGVVLGAGSDQALILFDLGGGSRVMARPGVPFTVLADGQTLRLRVTRIDSDSIEVEAPDLETSLSLPGIGAMGAPTGARANALGSVAYVEFRELPLLDALRMLSSQTGQNFSASSEANKIPVNTMLRHVPAASVVEEICKSHGLWFKLDELSGITRIMTVEEFEKDLTGYREEQTEVFTLRYPNVNEVAFAIADLYGDRVEFSMGAEESEASLRRDLESRFDRFDVLTQRTQMAGAMSGNIIGGNVNGFVNNGGNLGGFGFLNGGLGMGMMPGMGMGMGGMGMGGMGMGGGFGMENGRFNRRGENRDDTLRQEEGLFDNLTPSQVQRVERALAEGTADGDVEALRKRPATIFVTASRRNNQVIVRTADATALTAIRDLVTQLDVQTPLVLLEVKVVSIDLGTEFRSAFDYQFSDGTTAAAFTRDNIPLPPDGGALPAASLNSSDMTFVIANDNFRARIQLFEQQNRLKTVATPTLLTMNNEVSRLFLGEERPLVRNINSQTIITDNNIATTPNTQTEFRNVGNTLLITPNINSDRTVTLRLVQENSVINPDGATIPVVTARQSGNSVEQVAVDTVGTRSISGTFVAKDGMMVAAGGLIEEVDNDRRGQVPVLGRVPVLGFLFQRKERDKGRRELVVIIRPYVMTTPEDGQRISRDVLQRLAPESAQRLVEEGFLPSLLPPPPASPVASPNPALSPAPAPAELPQPTVSKKRFWNR
jgi:general secretion pathway protein D